MLIRNRVLLITFDCYTLALMIYGVYRYNDQEIKKQQNWLYFGLAALLIYSLISFILCMINSLALKMMSMGFFNHIPKWYWIIVNVVMRIFIGILARVFYLQKSEPKYEQYVEIMLTALEVVLALVLGFFGIRDWNEFIYEQTTEQSMTDQQQ